MNFLGDQTSGLVKSETIIRGQNLRRQNFIFGERPNGNFLLTHTPPNGSTIAYDHFQADVLKKYAAEVFGEIQWTEEPMTTS